MRDDEIFMENMRRKRTFLRKNCKIRALGMDTGSRTLRHLEIVCRFRREKYLEMLTRYYDRQLQVGFPQCNVNTAAPYLTLSYLAEYLQSETYLQPCRKPRNGSCMKCPEPRKAGYSI